MESLHCALMPKTLIPGYPSGAGSRFSVLKAGYVVLTNAVPCPDADRKRSCLDFQFPANRCEFSLKAVSWAADQ